MASALVPAIYDTGVADADLGVSTEGAYAAATEAVREHGLPVGISGGAAIAGNLAVAREAGEGAVVVTVLADSGDRYLSERFWDEP